MISAGLEAVGHAESGGGRRHELHEPGRPGRGDGVDAPRALDRDDRERERGRDAGADGGAAGCRCRRRWRCPGGACRRGPVMPLPVGRLGHAPRAPGRAGRAPNRPGAARRRPRTTRRPPAWRRRRRRRFEHRAWPRPRPRGPGREGRAGAETRRGAVGSICTVMRSVAPGAGHAHAAEGEVLRLGRRRQRERREDGERRGPASAARARTARARRLARRPAGRAVGRRRPPPRLVARGRVAAGPGPGRRHRTALRGREPPVLDAPRGGPRLAGDPAGIRGPGPAPDAAPGPESARRAAEDAATPPAAPSAARAWPRGLRHAGIGIATSRRGLAGRDGTRRRAARTWPAGLSECVASRENARNAPKSRPDWTAICTPSTPGTGHHEAGPNEPARWDSERETLRRPTCSTSSRPSAPTKTAP